MDQLSFLPKIDEDATWSKVEELLIKCLLYEQTEYIPEEAGTTPSYSLTPPSETNQFHSQTEDVAARNVDTERYRADVKRRVRKAVSRLDHIERELIERRYLTDSYETDVRTWQEMHTSESTYYRVKLRAFYKLAFALRVEVVKE